MRLRFVMTCAANAYLFLFIQVVAARQLNDRCVYPTGLREEMARKYPAQRPIRWKIWMRTTDSSFRRAWVLAVLVS